MKSDSDKKAQEVYWALVKKGAKDAEQRLERLGSVAELEAKKRVLAEKQDLISTAFDRAMEMLQNLPEDEYTRFLAVQAFKASRNGKEQLIFSKKDRANYGKKVCTLANELLAGEGKNAGLTLSEETRDMAGGLILIDGDVEMNCSLETLLRISKRDISRDVSKILFD
ncbi:MAG: V-type ATP synthase subunit E [Oscillospiraceae bacterium]|nr:V-type ATP synthase subunit E [Oscillospiraceae bacterium]